MERRRVINNINLVEHTYKPNYYVTINTPNNMVLENGFVVSGGATTSNGRVDPEGTFVSGRCADPNHVLIGMFGGKHVGLKSYILSTGTQVYYTAWFGKLINNQWDGHSNVSSNQEYLSQKWLDHDIVLPSSSNINVLLMSFRKGTGSYGEFTLEERIEIAEKITIY